MKPYYNDKTIGTKNNPIETNNQIEILSTKIQTNAWYSFTCVCCNKRILRRFRRSRLDFYKKFLCGECGRENTMVERFGVPHALQNEKYIAKMEATNMNRYGTKHYMCYGSDEFKQLMLNNYGDENYCNREKILDTFNEVYGGNSPFCSKRVKNEAKKTLLERYSTDNVFKLKEFQNLRKKTMISKYGVPYSGMSKELSEKTIDTKLKIYGTISLSGRMYYYGMKFDSSWELAVWIYCVDNNIPIIREPCYFEYNGPNGEIDVRRYIPDFMIDGKLVEIKGDQFFKPDGTMCYPYTKKKVNGEWIHLTPEEKKYFDDLYERKYKYGLANGIEFWKESDCKLYIDYCNQKYPGWQSLYHKDNPLNPSYWCFNIINPGHFQPQYFYPISQQGVSPFDIKCDEKYVKLSDKGITPFDIPH